MRIISIFLYWFILSSSIFPEWERTGGPEGISISCLVSFDSTLYAGTIVDGLYLSNDDGQTWSPLNNGIDSYEVTSVIKRDNYMLVGTFGHGVYRSNDNGQTWLPSSNYTNLAVSALTVQDSFIFAGSSSNGVFRSADNGMTWVQIISGFFSVSAMCVSGNALFVSTYGYTYASIDFGDTWYPVNSLTGGGIFSLYARDSLLIAGGVNKIFKSTNYGSSFITITLNFSFGNVNIYDFTESDSTFFIATSYDGVYKSVDSGLTWSVANNGMGPKDVRALIVSKNSTLIAGTEYVGLYRSEDNGSSWNKSMSGFPFGSSIAGLFSNNEVIFAGTRGDGLYRSTDSGETWIKITDINDTLEYATVQGICQMGEYVYIAPRLQFNSTVYKSADYGMNWIRCGTGLPPDLSFIFDLATSGNNIIACSDEGIYYSPDNGKNWYISNVQNVSVHSMTAGGGFLYAADPGLGIYRSSDHGVQWMPVLQGSVDWVEVAAIDNFVYAGTFFTGARYSSNYGVAWFECGGFAPDASVFALEAVDDGIVLAGTDISTSWIYASFDNGQNFSPYSDGLGVHASVEVFAVNDSFLFAGTNDNGVWRSPNPCLTAIDSRFKTSKTFQLDQNYPNPFNPVTVISYRLPVTSNITLTIYNSLGQTIQTLISEKQNSGKYEIKWDASGFACGVYYYRIETGDYSKTRKMILMK